MCTKISSFREIISRQRVKQDHPKLEIVMIYCLAIEVNIITDHIPAVTILKKDASILSPLLQSILPRIHQYIEYAFSKSMVQKYL